MKWMTLMNSNLKSNLSDSTLEFAYIRFCAGKWDAFLGLPYFLRTYEYDKLRTYELDGENITIELFALQQERFTLYLVGTETNILFATKNYEIAYAVYEERKQCIKTILQLKGEK